MQQEAWKEQLLKIILLIGGVVLTAYPVVYYLDGKHTYALIEAAVGSTMWISLLYVSIKNSFYWPMRVAWFGVHFILIFLLFTGGFGGVGLVWLALSPIVSFILFGSKDGAKGVYIFVFSLLTITLLQILNLVHPYFSPGEILQSVGMVLVSSSILYYYEKISGLARESSLSKSEILKEQLKINKNIEVELNKHIINIETDKTQQENIRSAMINLLEDSQKLENQLKIEKADVEKKVEERTFELNQQKIVLSSSVSSLPLGFVMFDNNHSLININNRALDILGKQAKHVTTFEDISSLFPKDSNFIKIHDAFHDSNTLKLVRGETDLGSKILKISFVPIIPESNKPQDTIGSILLIDDITEAKIQERSKDEFFSIASHELRTPLTAIRGNTSMILDYYAENIKEPELKAMIDDVHQSSIRLINIVNDFLNVSRLEQGRMTYDTQAFDVEKIITEIIKEFDVTGSRKKISIEHVASSVTLPSALGDPDKIRQVLINLLGNALKFTTKGGIKIKTQVEGKNLKVSVTDSGRGIAEKEQGLLFHKFTQAGKSIFTRDTAGGTGLGLYISKKMMEGMKGDLILEKSEVGKGSTFSLILPIATKENTPDRLEKIGLSETTTSTTSPKNTPVAPKTSVTKIMEKSKSSSNSKLDKTKS